jgi:hypothetical protein
MTEISFELAGDVTLNVTISELLDGTLRFDLAVDTDTGMIGDLNGLFFDLSDATLLDGLTITGDDVTGVIYDENSVTKVDNYNNLNGEIVKEAGRFDAGVQFGTQGIAQDDIQQTSFVLSHDSQSLSLDLFLAMDFGARLTSTGEIDGARDGSVKLGGKAPEEPPVTGPENIANDDSMSVTSAEGFNPDFPDFLDSSDPFTFFSSSLLDNDTSDGAVYTGPIISVEGNTFTDGMIVTGSNGGLLQVNADGTVDFSANGEFDALTPDDTVFTQFIYTIEGGDEAVLTVRVSGFDDTGGGGGDFNPFGPFSATDSSFDIV